MRHCQKLLGIFDLLQRDVTRGGGVKALFEQIVKLSAGDLLTCVKCRKAIRPSEVQLDIFLGAQHARIGGSVAFFMHGIHARTKLIEIRKKRVRAVSRQRDLALDAL